MRRVPASDGSRGRVVRCPGPEERLAVLAQAPRDAHEGVAVLGKALAADASATGDLSMTGSSSVSQPSRGVEVFWRGPAIDRQGVGAELCGPDNSDPGKASSGSARHFGRVAPASWLFSESAMSALQLLASAAGLAPRRAARSPASAGGSRAGASSCPAQNAAVAVCHPTRGPRNQRALCSPAVPVNAAAHSRTAWPVGDSIFSARP